MPETTTPTARAATPGMLTTSEIRRQFIDFFTEKHGHSFAPSSPVVPHDDPTLLFANAGMNQFKDVFLAQGNREYTRAVNTQKCIRAGGKHNDLEDVGKDTYHHTFFEMLGNWSFGDYFKQEAIKWAWTLLTDVWGLDKDRLYVTVFEGDAADGTQPDLEAETIWKQYVAKDRISRWDKKDNFWEMGDSGPCGPCSEIHYDGRSDTDRAKADGSTLVNRDHPDVIEIWNLVFIEFNRTPGSGGKPGTLTPLPAKHVDTGMGLERVARVLQGKTSNYDIDIWQPIFQAIQQRSGAAAYGGELHDPIDTAYRVIADHARCLTVAITDGARPGNEGRGYVLRRILRRAVRIAHQTLKIDGTILSDIVPAVVESLGDAFPELTSKSERVAEVIREEELSFLRTLDRGLELFDEAADRAAQLVFAANPNDEAIQSFVLDDLRRQGEVSTDGGYQHFHPRDADWSRYDGDVRPGISADDAFKLHDTYGFPIDLTRIMAEERGMTVDEAGYEKLMEEARERSRAGGVGHDAEGETNLDLPPDAIAKLKNLNIPPTADIDKYHGRPVGADVKAIWNGHDFDNQTSLGKRVAVILDRTNFYAEQGGQVGDTGELLTEWDPGQLGTRGHSSTGQTGGCTFNIENTTVSGGYVLHIGAATDDTLRVGDQVSCKIDSDHRSPIRANHTATHALNFALRKVISDEIDQRGSLVAADRLRFDYSHGFALNSVQIQQVQQIVNTMIAEALPVHAGLAPLNKAQSIAGLRAVFGEKYPDPVRVVSIGPSVDELIAEPDNEKWTQYSVEFCGGTHLDSTEQAGQCVILSEQALAAGVRRIIALTGVAAMAAEQAGIELIDQLEFAAAGNDELLAGAFDEVSRRVDELTVPYVMKYDIKRRLDELRDRVKSYHKSQQAESRGEAVQQARRIAEQVEGEVLCDIIFNADKDALLAALDAIKAKRPEAAALLLTPNQEDGKVIIVAAVPKPLIARGLKAGDWVRETAKACGGSGGGRPDSAQAGGKQPDKADDALAVATEFARDALK